MSLFTELTEEWRVRAACRDLGPEKFFLGRGSEDYDEARVVCAQCPVRIDCLNYALRCEPVVQSHRIGFWGGMLPNERREIAARIGRLHICSECGAPFQSRCSTARVCSPLCRKRRNARLRRAYRHAMAAAA